jgi:spermidine synthase
VFASGADALRDNSPAAMKQRYVDDFDGRPPLPPAVIDQWVVQARMARIKQTLDTASSELNRDLHPVSYLAFLRVWDQFAGGGFARGLRALVGVPAWAWVLALAAVCGLTLLAPRLGARTQAASRYALASVATSGFVGMTVTVLAVLTYQSLFGQMYEKVALLVAGYMAGLALGGWWTTRRLRKGIVAARLLAAGDLALAACGALFLAYLLLSQDRVGWTREAFLLALVVLSGACAGVAFPAAAAVLAGQGVGLGRQAGRVDAVDHFAALTGALTVGVVLLPAVGLPAVCAMWIAVKISSFAAATMGGFNRRAPAD